MDPVRTRLMVCPIFGNPEELPENVLPTYEDMMKYYILVKHTLKPTKQDKDPTVAEVSDPVSQNIESLWVKLSIPIVSHTRVLQLIRTHHDKYMNILKPYKGRKDNPSYQKKLKDFRLDSRKKLFDIAACKCSDFSQCNCVKMNKVPPKKQEFLLDQRGMRTLAIGKIDDLETKRLQKRLARNKMEFCQTFNTCIAGHSGEHSEQRFTAASESSHSTRECQDSSEWDAIEDASAAIEICQPQRKKKRSSQMRTSLPNVALIADRYGVSDRAAAAISSACLQDIGIIVKDSTMVIDKSNRKRKYLFLNKQQ